MPTAAASDSIMSVQKSFRDDGSSEKERISSYCLSHSTPLHPLQKKLMEETIRESALSIMLGAPEVLNINTCLLYTSPSPRD